MSAVTSRAGEAVAAVPPGWHPIRDAAPMLAVTMLRYLEQIAVSLRPLTVNAVEIDLRIFARFLIDHDPALSCAADIDRSHIEAFKVWQHAQPGTQGSIKASTFRRRIGMLRMFFVRIVEWGWDDAPVRVPIFFGDVPNATSPCPASSTTPPSPGSCAPWPLSPGCIAEWPSNCSPAPGCASVSCASSNPTPSPLSATPTGCASPSASCTTTATSRCTPTSSSSSPSTANPTGRAHPGRLLSGEHGPLNRNVVARWVATIARRAGIDHVNPHRLRHTLATQAINRGMSIEAIAALLGHRSLDMTRQYARIANRVVADEYNAVSAKVEALYREHPLPADAEGPNMRRLRAEVHHRLLGNGWCQRPVELDCSFESICESCTHFATGPTFRPVLLRQRNHAARHGQTGRAELFDHLLDTIQENTR